ncbi:MULTISPECIES: DUF456 domain-containing protein [Lysinibacillus]|jgi:uncharacterized protein YqgC (DUF456 family)|uniref:DUF456 domain-containing protein n=1 Tax=Lysinibacillus fusiformis TaxID=28031 RepID=A0A2I0V150_9BACI|nr:MULTISPECIES: DUF456 domain-containing protein [Lysinibacillus]KUF30177.1 hypothetical protein AK833_17070 [Lysinibacillus sp. F5]MEE3805963.1 DUF456 domain-containing protein [Lysinibacillus fusiformis]PKU51952.1 DUF456 domain-containing protein [Lysinibacillus fusiformis]WCH46277.1 DUF456 domain-containing protein [Lysinibacillus sp. OF-1]SCY76802.1 hypothetical protein SAMN02787078_02457 [Lysinibacillus sp. SG9]
MEVIGWILVIACFIISFIGLVYPIIPGVLFLVGGFLLYGVFFSFAELSWWFWVIEILFVVLLFGADTVANAFGIKKFGGSNAGMWGSTIGLLIGPFVIPVAGILIGPFLGAVIAELIVEKRTFNEAVKSGVGSLIGFLTSTIAKAVIQIVMIIVFFIAI